MTDHSRGALDRIRRLRTLAASGFKALPIGQRLGPAAEHAAMAVVAAFAAYLPTQALGLREGFWGAITALSVVQSEYQAARTTARDQFAGAAIGGITGVGAVLIAGQDMTACALAIAVSVLVAWIANAASAARLAAITATIILLVPHRDSAQAMMLSRVGEVGWGVAVAIAVVRATQFLRERFASR